MRGNSSGRSRTALRKILGWIMHLSGKAWITPRQLQLFVEYAAEANGITIEYNA
jgi:hypothetical protein